MNVDPDSNAAMARYRGLRRITATLERRPYRASVRLEPFDVAEVVAGVHGGRP